LFSLSFPFKNGQEISHFVVACIVSAVFGRALSLLPPPGAPPASASEQALSHVQIARVIALPLWTDCLFGADSKQDGDGNSIKSEQGTATHCWPLPYCSRAREERPLAYELGLPDQQFLQFTRLGQSAVMTAPIRQILTRPTATSI
jgi:hypothetical protein